MAEKPTDLNAEFQAFMQSAEYQESLRRQRSAPARDVAFLKVPIVVCGIRLRPLTLPDMAVLYHLGVPFLARKFIGGKLKPVVDVGETFNREAEIRISQADIARFLWIQSEAFCESGFRKWWFVFSKCRPLKYEKACEEIRQYMQDALSDQPAPSGGRGVDEVASWIAARVFEICTVMPWEEATVLNMPVSRIYQYERCALASRGKLAALTSEASDMRARWLIKKRTEIEQSKRN